MIIGFTGKKQAGKDTTAYFIKEYIGDKKNVYIMSYADKLKQSAAASLGFFGEDYVDFCDYLKSDGSTVSFQFGASGEGDTITGRQYLQWFGTEGHREIFGEKFWVDALMDEISSKAQSYEDDLFLITDIRYDNEAEEIANLNLGVVVKIVRPNNEIEDTHASEQPINPKLVKYAITNDGSLDDLRKKSIDLIKRIDI